MSDCTSLRMLMNPKGEESLWLYIHDYGHDLPKMLQEALKLAHPRWDVPTYTNRVIVEQILKQVPDRDPVLGWGLGLMYTDSYYNVLELDMARKMVRVRQTNEGSLGNLIGDQLTFDAYVELADPNEYRDHGVIIPPDPA